MNRAALLSLILFLPAGPIFAQFELQVVEGAGPRIAPSTYDLAETGSARFRLRNITAVDLTASTLTVAGAGFSLAAPALPATVSPSMSLEFSVNFRATELGAYSAVLHAENVTILLTAIVRPRLTCRVGDSPLGDLVDFGSAPHGTAVHRRFTLANETPQPLTVPAILLSGAGFAFPAPPSSGILLPPQQSTSFLIDFVPSSSGVHQATLTIGERTISLLGIATDPPLPHPLLSVELNPLASSQQGTLVVNFDQPAQSTGVGTAALDFRGSADPTVTFASGGRTASFNVSPGDTRIALPFQTGSTAGTLIFSVNLGQEVETLAIQIPATTPALTEVKGSRAMEGVEVRVTGWDNTHSITQMEFTFYDAGGVTLSPGTLYVNLSSEFARFYAASGTGGAFAVKAAFPVRGDTSAVASFQVSVIDLIGTTRSARNPVE